MLKLKAKRVSISQISKLLVSYNVSSSINEEVITLYGDITDELLEKLFASIECICVQNFENEESQVVCEVENDIVEFDEGASNGNVVDTITTLSANIPDYDLLFSKVKRGEVYLCDLGTQFGSEQSEIRPVIVIQNDVGNNYSPTTIVVPCTLSYKKDLPVHYTINFSYDNMEDCKKHYLNNRNTILFEHIRTIDKRRLREYIGIMKPEFMQSVQNKIEISLGLEQKSEHIKYVEKEVKVPASVQPKPIIKKDVNLIQLELLTYADINGLFLITQSSDTIKIKTKKILELFGFDFNKNGVEFLLEVIISEPNKFDYNLESLTKSVARKLDIDSEEISRLVIARVKENFHFKKAPTMDFIRLIRSFVIK